MQLNKVAIERLKMERPLGFYGAFLLFLNISRQEPSGTWKLFYDEPEGNLSATIVVLLCLAFNRLQK